LCVVETVLCRPHPLHHKPSTVDQELGEVPFDEPAKKASFQLFQVFEEWVRARTIDVYFSECIEFGVVGRHVVENI